MRYSYMNLTQQLTNLSSVLRTHLIQMLRNITIILKIRLPQNGIINACRADMFKITIGKCVPYFINT